MNKDIIHLELSASRLKRVTKETSNMTAIYLQVAEVFPKWNKVATQPTDQ